VVEFRVPPPQAARRHTALRDDFVDDVAVHVGQAEIAAGVMIRQFFVIESEEPENGRVQIMHVDRILDGLEPELVGGAVHIAAFHATAGHPHRKPVMIMVTAIDFSRVRAGRRQLHRRRASEFAAPDHESVIQEPALLEIFQKRADRLIALAGETPVIHLDVIMIIPRLSFAMPDLDEANTAFDQAACDENLPRLRPLSVHVADILWLP